MGAASAQVGSMRDGWVGEVGRGIGGSGWVGGDECRV